MKPLHFIAVMGLTLLNACTSLPRDREAHPPTRVFPANAEVVLSSGDASLGTYISTWKGFRTSSYWIEGPTGLILIDAQFLTSAAEQMVDWAEQATGKKAVLAIVLHPNPDKFNGTAVFQKRGIRVITSSQVLARIPAVHKLRSGWFFERFKPDYPIEEPKPESFGDRTQEIQAAGLTLKLHVLGAGCSEAHVAVEHRGHLFVGDLVTQGFHSWLELGLLDEWRQRISELQALKPKAVHTGRGGSGDADLLDREDRYLRDVIEILRKRHPTRGKLLDEDEFDRIKAEIVARYPAYDYPLFIGKGLEPAWQRMCARIK